MCDDSVSVSDHSVRLLSSLLTYLKVIRETPGPASRGTETVRVVVQSDLFLPLSRLLARRWVAAAAAARLEVIDERLRRIARVEPAWISLARARHQVLPAAPPPSRVEHPFGGRGRGRGRGRVAARRRHRGDLGEGSGTRRVPRSGGLTQSGGRRRSARPTARRQPPRRLW